jgi:hypothetical protein
MAESKYAAMLVSFICGIILLVLGLAMSNPMNSTITNITTGTNATANGSAATAMWQIVPLIFAVVLLLIPIGMAFSAWRQGRQ